MDLNITDPAGNEVPFERLLFEFSTFKEVSIGLNLSLMSRILVNL